MEMGEPPKQPDGVMHGYLTEVETDFDSLTGATRIRIHITLDDLELREQGGLGWLQPGSLIEIRQYNQP